MSYPMPTDTERLNFVLQRSGGIHVSWPINTPVSGRTNLSWTSWANRKCDTREELDAAMAECEERMRLEREDKQWARAA